MSAIHRREMKKTATARWKRAERQRMRDAGFVLRQIWVRPEDWERIQNYLRRFKGRTK